MHRIDEAGNIANQFTEGNPSSGTPATKVGAPWLNSVQEEICNAVTADGTALVKATTNQLQTILAAIVSTAQPSGRISVVTGNAAPAADTAGSGTVYYTPYVGGALPLYNGTRWVLTHYTEMAQATTDITKSPAAVVAYSNYDIFVWNDAGTVRATRGPAWTSNTARGAGTGTSEITTQDGRLVNKYAITNGPVANCGLYVGTVRSNGSALIDDTAQSRHVWNMYNRVDRTLARLETVNSWTYNGAAYRQANANALNFVSILRGLEDDAVSIVVKGSVFNGTSGVGTSVGIGIDSVLVDSSLNNQPAITQAHQSIAEAEYRGSPGLGYHYFAWLEFSQNVGSTAFFGYDASPGATISGILGTTRA